MYMVIFRDLSLLMHCLDPAPYIGNVMTQPVNDDPWIFCKIVSVTRSLTFSPSCRKDEWDEKTKEVWIAWRTRHGPTRLGVVFLFVGVCGAKSRQNKICVTEVYDHMILLACIIWYHVFLHTIDIMLYYISSLVIWLESWCFIVFLSMLPCYCICGMCLIYDDDISFGIVPFLDCNDLRDHTVKGPFCVKELSLLQQSCACWYLSWILSISVAVTSNNYDPPPKKTKKRKTLILIFIKRYDAVCQQGVGLENVFNIV